MQRSDIPICNFHDAVKEFLFSLEFAFPYAIEQENRFEKLKIDPLIEVCDYVRKSEENDDIVVNT